MHIEMEPMNRPETDHEGAMAKADLYKLANYSIKLFKQLDGNQQLEGWVQAKITKAADYIASVYHYMEYEMKFSEYGQAIEDSDVYTESQKRELKNKLFEAKEKIKDLKKAQAEKLKKKEKKDEQVDEASGFRATDKKKGKVEKSEKKQYFVKLEKEGKTKGVTMVADEGETEGDVRDRAKRDNQGWSVASVRAKDTGSGEEVSETFMPVKKEKKDDPVTGTIKKAGKVVGKGIGKAVDAAKGAMSDKAVPEGKRMKDKKSQEGNKFTGNLAKARAAGAKQADLDGDGDMEKVQKENQGAPAPMSAMDKAKAMGSAMVPGMKKAAMTYGAMKALGVKETTVSGAPQKSGIPATAKTTVPGMRATQQDLKKANSSAALGEKRKGKK